MNKQMNKAIEEIEKEIKKELNNRYLSDINTIARNHRVKGYRKSIEIIKENTPVTSELEELKEWAILGKDAPFLEEGSYITLKDIVSKIEEIQQGNNTEIKPSPDIKEVIKTLGKSFEQIFDKTYLISVEDVNKIFDEMKAKFINVVDHKEIKHDRT